MKTIFLSAMFTACCGLFSLNGFAQNEQPQSKKNEEIIIRKNGEAPSKMLIAIDSNNITINGKPLSDYNGNITVLKRNFMGGEGNNIFTPGQSITMYPDNNKAFLGVLTAKIDKGAVIKNVVDGSAAKNAGLQEGDIITKVNDIIISSPEDLRTAIGAKKVGDNVMITYLRDGKEQTQKIELGKNESNAITLNSDNMQGMMGNMMPLNNYNFKMPQMPQSLNSNNFNDHPKMGLRIEDTENGDGVKILDVEQGSAAAKAGLKKDDIVKEINGEKVNNVDDVMSQINQSTNQNNYTIKATRGGNEKSFDVVIPKELKKIDL